MNSFAVAGIVVGVLLALGLGALAATRRAGPPASEVDPIFFAGIALAGAGSALLATIGVAGVGVAATGVALIAIGIIRTRRGHGHR